MDDTPIVKQEEAPASHEENGSNGIHGDAVSSSAVPDETTEAGALAEEVTGAAEVKKEEGVKEEEPTTNGAPEIKKEEESEATNGEPAPTTTSTTNPPSDEQIIDAMREIIKSNPVSELTIRKLMVMLEKEFNQELSSRKTLVKDNIATLIEEQQSNGDEVNAEEGEEAGEEDADVDEDGDTKVKDEPEDTLNMTKEELEEQKLIMQQIKYGSARVTRGKASGRAPPKPFKPKKRKSTEGEGEDGEPKKKKKTTSRMNKPKILSPALAEFLGESEMTRPDVVQKLHLYFKEHNLQNPKNKKQILLDEKLQEVFKRKTTDYFKLNALLTKHLTDPGELVD